MHVELEKCVGSRPSSFLIIRIGASEPPQYLIEKGLAIHEEQKHNKSAITRKCDEWKTGGNQTGIHQRLKQ